MLRSRSSLLFSVLLLAAVAAPPRAAAQDSSFPDPTGTWEGEYVTYEDDTGDPRWWGFMDLEVDAAGNITGDSDLTNNFGGYWTITIEGYVKDDGQVRLFALVSDGDYKYLRSLTSTIVEGRARDTWTFTYEIPGWPMLNTEAVLERKHHGN